MLRRIRELFNDVFRQADLVLLALCIGTSLFGILMITSATRYMHTDRLVLVQAAALAIGVVATSLSSGSNVDVMNYLFGSILTMTAGDVKLAAGLSFAVLLLFLLLYHRIFAVTFDETFARATGIRANLYNMVLALLTAVTIVIGMRLMGTLLISSLIIFPALSAMRVCRSFLGVTLGAAVLSVVCFWVGVIASFLLSTPTGASVVLVDLLVFLLLSLYGLLRRRTRK